MKIVVLDGYTLNPGDLSWEGLRALGPCEIYDRTFPDQVPDRMADAHIALTNKALVARTAIEQSAQLRYIGVLATGYNIVDVEAAAERGIPVANVPTYGSRSVAQHVFAHVLAFAHHIEHHARSVVEGRWSASPDFCYWDHPLIELAGKTMGIVGFGRIGRATAELALAFGMNVVAHDPVPPADLPPGIRLAGLEDVFRESDFLSLHCPLAPQTERVVNAQRLALMKPTAVLINTGRGPLVDEQALAAALREGRIAAAGLDVLATEPPPRDNPLLTARNCLITPHIAWATKEARARLMQIVVDNVRAFLDGRPQNVVNGVG
jgi:glycerate dehydrogenase